VVHKGYYARAWKYARLLEEALTPIEVKEKCKELDVMEGCDQRSFYLRLCKKLRVKPGLRAYKKALLIYCFTEGCKLVYCKEQQRMLQAKKAAKRDAYARIGIKL
jgi:hypothetical protein